MRIWAACLAVVMALPVAAQESRSNILGAAYGGPTDRYDHGILGDAIEWGTLEFSLDMCPECALMKRGSARITLPENRVFEDLEPRVVDLDNDGFNEVIVVETDLNLGARLAVYDMSGLVAATPFIGSSHRWLAPVGAADFDGDGYMEIAYIDRPHLARELMIWRFKDRELEFVTSLGRLTNHQIGQDFISGGVRTCNGVPEIITVNGNWSRVMATRLEVGVLTARDIGPFKGQASLRRALKCK